MVRTGVGLSEGHRVQPRASRQREAVGREIVSEVRDMSEVARICLTPENASILQVLQEREAIALDDPINPALSDCLFSTRFDQVRARLSKPAAGQPRHTEDEILELVSRESSLTPTS